MTMNYAKLGECVVRKVEDIYSPFMFYFVYLTENVLKYEKRKLETYHGKSLRLGVCI